MKKYIIISLIAALFLTSCQEKVFDPVLQIGAAAAISTPADGTSFVLDEANAADILTKFEWAAADYGFPAGASYTLELDLGDGSFAAPINLGTVNGLAIENVTVGGFNTTLLANGVPDNTESDVYVRVVSNVASDVDPVASEKITLKVTPYLVVIDYPILHVPGSYQAWDPANDSTVVYSLKGDGFYEGYANFTAADDKFKYTDGPSWDTNWGDTGMDGILDPGGDDIAIGAEGFYKLNVNLNDLTHTFTKTDWGLIGDATPTAWDSDTDMVFDAASGTLKLTIDLTAGKIKFRANDLWDISLGDTDANGSLEYGGDDIVVAEAGNYTVELILNKAIYTYRLTKN